MISGILVLARNRSLRRARPSANVAAWVGVRRLPSLRSSLIGSSVWSAQLGGMYHPATEDQLRELRRRRAIRAYSRHSRVRGRCASEPKARSSRRAAPCSAMAGAMSQATKGAGRRPASEESLDMSASDTKLRQTLVSQEKNEVYIHEYNAEKKIAKCVIERAACF